MKMYQSNHCVSWDSPHPFYFFKASSTSFPGFREPPEPHKYENSGSTSNITAPIWRTFWVAPMNHDNYVNSDRYAEKPWWPLLGLKLEVVWHRWCPIVTMTIYVIKFHNLSKNHIILSRIRNQVTQKFRNVTCVGYKRQRPSWRNRVK